MAASERNEDLVHLLRAVAEDGNSPLLLACASGNVDDVEQKLREGAAIGALNSLGESAMHAAAASGSLELIKLLQRKEPLLLSSRSSLGWMPIHSACWYGRTRAVEAFLDFGSGSRRTRRVADHAGSPLLAGSDDAAGGWTWRARRLVGGYRVSRRGLIRRRPATGLRIPALDRV